jgi:cobalt-zinc-cadmium efflux system outer membrane protein
MGLLFGVLVMAEALTFQDALERVERAPARQTTREVAETRAAGVGEVPLLTENPVFQVQPGVRSRARGDYLPEVYVQLSQPFLTSGLGSKRREALQGEQRVDEARTRGVTLQLRSAVATAWLARWAAQEAVGFAGDERRLAAEFQDELQRAAALGEATAVDLAAARTWAAEARLAELTAEGEATAAGYALARLLGLEAVEPPAVGDAPSIALDGELHAQIAMVDAMPNVWLARAGVAAAAARVRELEATRSTRFAVGALGWREGSGDVAAVATLEVSPAWIERGQRDIASARAELVRAQGLAREARLEAVNERAVLVHEVEHTGRVLEVAEGEALAAAELLAAAQAARVAEGEGTAQDLVIARRALWRARIDAARAHAAHLLARFQAREAFAGGAP